MHFNDYQEAIKKFAAYKNRGGVPNYYYPAFEIAEEAGEVAGKIGKVLRDHDGVMTSIHKQEIGIELGDLLWGIATLALELGYYLETIAQMNLSKLTSRQERGVLHGSGDNR